MSQAGSVPGFSTLQIFREASHLWGWFIINMQQQLTQPSWAWILETAAEVFHPRDSSESDPSHSMSYKPGSDLQGYLDKQTKNRSVSSLTLCVQYLTSQVLISRDTWTNKQKTEAFHLWPFTFHVLQARFWSPGIPEQINRSISFPGLLWA